MLLLRNGLPRAAVLVAAVALLAPSLCQAGMFDCFRYTPPTPAPSMTYAPPYQPQVSYMPTAGACDPCNTCNPCNPCAAPATTYVPETRYRWRCSRINRTEYQPVASYDPCSGCPTTTFKPVTKKSLLPWLHREAYTTYKAVPAGGQVMSVGYMQPTCNPCATTCNPCGISCDPCGTTCGPTGCGPSGCYGGMSAPSLSSGCSTCTTGSSSSSDPGYTSSGQTYADQPTEDPNSGWSAPTEGGALKPTPGPIDDPEPAPEVEEPVTDDSSMPKLIVPTGRSVRLDPSVRAISYQSPVVSTPPRPLASRKCLPMNMVPVE